MSHGKNSIDEEMPSPLLLSIYTPTDFTTSNVSCFVEATNDLYCNVKIHTDAMNKIVVPDTLHAKSIVHKSTRYRLTLKCFSLRNTKLIILSAHELPFSSSVSCSPLTFLKNALVDNAGVAEFDDINDVFMC